MHEFVGLRAQVHAVHRPRPGQPRGRPYLHRQHRASGHQQGHQREQQGQQEEAAEQRQAPGIPVRLCRRACRHQDDLTKGLAGLPTTVTPGGTSLVTTAPMPTMAPLPITSGLSGVPCLMMAPVPI